MDNKKDIFKIIEEYPKKQNVSADVTSEAKRLAEEIYGGNSIPKLKHFSFKALYVSLVSCVALILIALPFFINMFIKNERYYSADQIQSVKVENMENFVIENKLSIKYFTSEQAMSKNSAHYIQKTNTLVYLIQSSVVIQSYGFDMVELGIVLTDDSFERFQDYDNFDQKIKCNEIMVQYLSQKDENNKNIIKAKFSFDKVKYYINITTTGETGILDSYVKMLIS